MGGESRRDVTVRAGPTDCDPANTAEHDHRYTGGNTTSDPAPHESSQSATNAHLCKGVTQRVDTMLRETVPAKNERLTPRDRSGRGSSRTPRGKQRQGLGVTPTPIAAFTTTKSAPTTMVRQSPAMPKATSTIVHPIAATGRNHHRPTASPTKNTIGITEPGYWPRLLRFVSEFELVAAPLERHLRRVGRLQFAIRIGVLVPASQPMYMIGGGAAP